MKHLLFILAMSLIPFAVPCFAESTAESEAGTMKTQSDAGQQALLDAPAGVFNVEYDESGSLARLKIKGETEVSATLKGVRADKQARERAERNAKAAFSKFLNENVVVVESDSEIFIIREKDGSESAEYLSASARSVNSLSHSFQRGLITLMDHVSGTGAERKAVVVLGWSKKLTLASMQAEGAMKAKPVSQPQNGQKAAPDADTQPDGKESGKTQTRSGNLNDF